MSAAIKLPCAEAESADHDYAPVSTLTQYISSWRHAGVRTGTGKWPVGKVNLCSVMIDQVGFGHRKVNCIAEFQEFGPERYNDGIIEVRGQPHGAQRQVWQRLYREHGAAMLSALSKLHSDVLASCRGAFYSRMMNESDTPYFLSQDDLQDLPDVDSGIFHDAKSPALRLWPLPHLLEFFSRGATTADFTGACGTDTRSEELRSRLVDSFDKMGSDASNGIVCMSFRYRASTQRLECESPVDLIDLLNCSVASSAKGVADNTFRHDSKNNVAVGVALPDEGYARFRFLRPAVAKNLCFEAAFRYRVHESEAPGLLGALSHALRASGFRLQQMSCPSSFERIGRDLFEEGEIRGLFQLMGQDSECKALLMRADAREIRSRLYSTLISLQESNRSHPVGRKTLTIFPPEYPRTLAAAARAWSKYALAESDD